MARNLLTRSKEFVGLDQKFWLILEDAYGDASTITFPAATDAIGHTTGTINFSIPREDSEYRSSRSVVTRLSGKKEVKWNMEAYIIPGAPDVSNQPTLPDAHPMLLTAFGQVDNTDPAKIIYKLIRTSLASFRMVEEGSHFARLAVGCVCDTITFTLPGDGKAMMKFEGFAQDAYISGESTLASAMTASNTAVVATGQGGRFEVGSYVDIIDKDDGNTVKAAGRKVTARSGDTLTLSGTAITAVLGDIIIGATPNGFTAEGAENALLGLTGSFSTAALGSVDCQLLSAEIAIKNNYTPKNQFYGTSKICGFIADKRRAVSVKLDVLLTKDNFEFYTNNKTFLADDLTITLAPQDIPAPINSATGRTFTFHMPKVEFNVPNLEQPADGFVKLTLEGIALADSIDNTNTEITLQIS